jgi:hypothetical protein
MSDCAKKLTTRVAKGICSCSRFRNSMAKRSICFCVSMSTNATSAVMTKNRNNVVCRILNLSATSLNNYKSPTS